TQYQEIKSDFEDIIHFSGKEAKRKTLTVIKRYYLELDKVKGKEFIKENVLHDLALKYSFETMKPLLLFVLLLKCDIAQFIQKKINLMFNNGKVDSLILLSDARKNYGDRRIVRFAVSYYLTVLGHFGVLSKKNSKYTWKQRKLNCPDYLMREMILLYARVSSISEIELAKLKDEVAFSFLDLSYIEDVLREYNSKDWVYQKRLDSAKIIVKKKL
ncbi:hypothetical protein ACFL6S_34850, partial [Candidatus Poribacteria bacterium]